MATPAQIAANQQNAMRSTGPVTGAGKDTSSRNSLRHGLTARKVLLSVEDKAEFDELREDFRAAFAPQTRYEQRLLEDTVRAYWSWSRAQCAHAGFLDMIVREERSLEPRFSAKQALALVFFGYQTVAMVPHLQAKANRERLQAVLRGCGQDG